MAVSAPETSVPGQEAEFARRLASLQRTLTQTLAATDPLAALVRRLKATCNATVLVIDRHGDVAHATGPAPLAGVARALAASTDEMHVIEFDGWHGIADRLHEGGEPQSPAGWLVVLSRRRAFPDPYATAAVQFGAALVETCQQLGVVARQQEEAIRAAVLEEVLAYRPPRDDPQLVGRVASLGMSLAEEVRVAIVQPARPPAPGRHQSVIAALTEGLRATLDDHAVRHLVSARNRVVVVAFQATGAAFARAAAAGGRLPDARVGIGRSVRTAADFRQSYDDAALALQTPSTGRRGVEVVAFEDFDMAMQLFADVGLNRMSEWARRFLGPVIDRPALLHGLHAFFRHGQNMNAAAAALHIHHNSLRYRLAKVEQMLSLTLHDPAAMSSMFLALRALELERFDFEPLLEPTGRRDEPADVAAPLRVGKATAPTADAHSGVARPPRPR